MPGVNPRTGENIANTPLPASVYADPANATVVSFDAFNASRNFRDPLNLKNQNGIVFFPGSTALYRKSPDPNPPTSSGASVSAAMGSTKTMLLLPSAN